MNYVSVLTNQDVVAQINYPSFEELVSIFLSAKDLKKTSVVSYVAAFAKFKNYLVHNDIPFVREEDLKKYKEHLKEKKLSIFTQISHLSAIKSLFAFTAARDLYPNVSREIKLPKKPKQFMRDPLTKQEAKELIKAAAGDDIIAKRDYALISILLRCGLRSVEAVRANIGNVVRTGEVPVLWVHGKGRDGADEFVVLTSEAHLAIKNYLELRKDYSAEDPLFASHSDRNNNKRLTTRSIRGIVKKHLRGIGVDELRKTCHSLRHTFATLCLANNAPLIAVQKALRHADINTTTTYVHVLDRLTNGAENYIDL
jgi:integrase/recombinase XerD